MTDHSKETILVLGCGPAGLLVAHACVLEGWKVHILSEKNPSYIAGAQYLHSSIPEITDEEPDGELSIIKVGSPKNYSMKVYGGEQQTSWNRLGEGRYGIWNLRSAYTKLWNMYENDIHNGLVLPRFLEKMSQDYKAIFSTIPLRALFPSANFKSVSVWISQETRCSEMTLVYNGDLRDGWYRSSNIFGHAFVEWPSEVEGATRILKPTWKDIVNPYVGKLFLFGRYGQWKRDVLVDDAFREATMWAGGLK